MNIKIKNLIYDKFIILDYRPTIYWSYWSSFYIIIINLIIKIYNFFKKTLKNNLS